MTNYGHYAEYNGYTLDYCSYSVDHKSRVTDSGTVESVDRTYNISSWITCATAAAQVTAIGLIRTAFGESGKILTIKEAIGATTIETFGPSQCNGNGPSVDFSFPDGEGTTKYNFHVELTVKGNTPPTGGTGGVLADDYTDSYQAGADERLTWTRTGTYRKSSAWSDQDGAFSSTDPSPSSSDWEFVSKTGKLDSDKKKFDYTFVYIEPWEARASEFAMANYTISKTRRGIRDDIAINATVIPDFKKGGAEGLDERAATWAQTKLPDNAMIISVNTTLNKRAGTASVVISAVSSTKDDVIEDMQTVTHASRVPHVVHNPMDGKSTPWGVRTGAPVWTITMNGRRVGLNAYPIMPMLPQEAIVTSLSMEDPIPGPNGKYFYPMSYSYTVFENIDLGGFDQIGGGGGGGASDGATGGSGGGAGTIVVGSTGGGFATDGLVTGFGSISGGAGFR